jgi:hypothetical protein
MAVQQPVLNRLKVATIEAAGTGETRRVKNEIPEAG